MQRRQTRRQVVQGAGAVGLGLLAGCGRWPGQAPKPKVHRVGWLGSEANMVWYEAFRQGMREQGYIEGQNLVLDARFADVAYSQAVPLVAEVVSQTPEVIVTATPVWTASARQVTQSVPIVFGISSDPVAEGVVASLARPGGNVTGLSVMNSLLNAKRVEQLAEIIPDMRRLAMLYVPAISEVSLRHYADETRAAAQVLGIETLPLEIRAEQDLEGLFVEAARQGTGAVAVLPGTVGYARRIVELALHHHLPTTCPQRDFAVAGGLKSYGPNYPANFRRAAVYVDKILQGASPADLPVEQPTTFEFVINLRTAQALGLTIPRHVLLQATEVIQ